MAAVSTAQRGSQAGSESQRTAPVQSRRPVLPQSGYAGWQWRKYPSRLTKLAQAVRHFTEERFWLASRSCLPVMTTVAVVPAGHKVPCCSSRRIRTGTRCARRTHSRLNQWSPYPWRPACCWHLLRQPPHYQPCPSAHYYCQRGDFSAIPGGRLPVWFLPYTPAHRKNAV